MTFNEQLDEIIGRDSGIHECVNGLMAYDFEAQRTDELSALCREVIAENDRLREYKEMVTFFLENMKKASMYNKIATLLIKKLAALEEKDE